MKLYYWHKTRWHISVNNFGDQLNPWLFSKLLGTILDEDPHEAVLGIGTLINDRIHKILPKAQKFHVFGSGVGYGDNPQNLPILDDSWNILWLRGPLSAKALGLSADFALTDPAMLIHDIVPPRSKNPRYTFSFMPHLYQAISGGHAWKEVCLKLGIHYIDPRWPVDTIISMISETNVLLAEALHGAIVADALRVPWIPIISDENILEFKWQDWCASVNLEYLPVPLSKVTYLSYLKRSQIHRAYADFEKIQANPTYYLSSDETLKTLLIKMHGKIDDFKQQQRTI